MPFALRNTYAHFKRNPWCGGLTGELRVERPYRNFLTSVQYMEWKVRSNCCQAGRREAGPHGGDCRRPSIPHAEPGKGGLARSLHRKLPLHPRPGAAAGVAPAEQAHRVHLRLPYRAAWCLLGLPLGRS